MELGKTDPGNRKIGLRQEPSLHCAAIALAVACAPAFKGSTVVQRFKGSYAFGVQGFNGTTCRSKVKIKVKIIKQRVT